ncbi:WAT1-related protein At5g64700-like [Prunus avium]|uniref:WAT1-related protein n=1 Tax=Prunus avium TaxID=42229 RepID=A0A6P5TZD9_PRUAV|nr:WAT1-related protein At5g64700-like [Prunus avium]
MGSTKPYLAVIFIQIIYAGMILLSKAAFNRGMNSYVFVFYRQMAGALFMSPLAMIFERKSATPLSVVTFCKIFMLSFLGITLAINAYCIALTYTSAALGAASINCLPVGTFFFAVLLSVLGGILLAASLYSVLWGKSKEQKSMENGTCLSVPVQPEKERAHLKEAEATIAEPTLFV